MFNRFFFLCFAVMALLVLSSSSITTSAYARVIIEKKRHAPRPPQSIHDDDGIHHENDADVAVRKAKMAPRAVDPNTLSDDALKQLLIEKSSGEINVRRLRSRAALLKAVKEFETVNEIRTRMRDQVADATAVLLEREGAVVDDAETPVGDAPKEGEEEA